MACAALEVLALTDRIDQRLDPAEFVPAVGQGCVAVDCRADDASTVAALRAIDHAATRSAVEVERAFLAELGSGCSLPVGAHVHDRRLDTFLAAERGDRVVVDSLELTGDVERDTEIAAAAAIDARRRVDA